MCLSSYRERPLLAHPALTRCVTRALTAVSTADACYDVRRPTSADATYARVSGRTRVAVTAQRAVGLGGIRTAPCAGVAAAGEMALVRCWADDGSATAHARLARVARGARVAVVAGGAVGLGRVRARPRTRVTGPRDVTLIGRGADNRVAAHTRSALAGLAPRAGITVAAGCAISGRRIRTPPGGGITRALDVALIGCEAHRCGPALAETALARLS